MAIKVQVKDDQKFDTTYTEATTCNGAFINDAYGVNPYTTTTLDGTCGMPFIGSRVPASLVSLCGNGGFQPSFAGLNTYGVNPFTYGANPFATATVNAFGQIVPTLKTGLNTSFAGTVPFQGWTVPATSELLSTTTPMLNGFNAPSWSAFKPAAFGAANTPFAAASTFPWMKSQQAAAFGFNPLASQWLAPTASFGAFDPAMGTTSMPWATAQTMSPAAGTVASQASMTSFIPVDIYENEDEYILLADMPGTSIEDVDILVEGQTLVIKGIVKPMSWDKNGLGLNTVTLLQEKPVMKSIERVFPLGSNVLTDKLTAKLIDGILTIKLPKVKVGYASTHRVAVAAA